MPNSAPMLRQNDEVRTCSSVFILPPLCSPITLIILERPVSAAMDTDSFDGRLVKRQMYWCPGSPSKATKWSNFRSST